MSFTVGLDFGTHQTKVCIEDASNPSQKIYEFLEFKNPYGKASVLFPSIVQINEDDTISYGFVDEEKCKFLNYDGIEKPKLNLLPKPELIFPAEPHKPVFPPKPKIESSSWAEKLKSFFNLKKQNESLVILIWEEECKKLHNEFDLALNDWKIKYNNLNEQFRIELNYWEVENQILEKNYHDRLSVWDNCIKEKLYFSYFKLATFSNSVKWNHKINSDIISIWYIAFILFLLQEKLGEVFFVQMGIPSGINHEILQMQKNKAFTILLAAYKLVDKYRTKEFFLAENYQNLLIETDLKDSYSEEEISFYGLNVMPEAYAGLSSITQQKRLERGMSLLVDIGGGTTDIAFFTTREDKPDIHSVLSFPKGLNFIFENYIHQNNQLTILEVQKMFFDKQGENSIFNSSIKQYHGHLKKQVNKMICDIFKSFVSRKNVHKLTISQLNSAMKNRPIVFCGGGAVYKTMRISLDYFADIKLINKNLLNIPFIKNHRLDESLLIILATSYGLAIPLENDIILTPIEKVFDPIVPIDNEKCDDKYDHGLTDN